MNRDQIISLLQVIAAYDNRKIDELVIRTWAESARRAAWAPEQAMDAVHEHFAKSTTWLMPGHVTEQIRATRRQPAPVADVLALERPTPVSDERRAEFMAQIRNIADRKAVH